jgi:hypothetical protein
MVNATSIILNVKLFEIQNNGRIFAERDKMKAEYESRILHHKRRERILAPYYYG